MVPLYSGQYQSLPYGVTWLTGISASHYFTHITNFGKVQNSKYDFSWNHSTSPSSVSWTTVSWGSTCTATQRKQLKTGDTQNVSVNVFYHQTNMYRNKQMKSAKFNNVLLTNVYFNPEKEWKLVVAELSTIPKSVNFHFLMVNKFHLPLTLELLTHDVYGTMVAFIFALREHSFLLFWFFFLLTLPLVPPCPLKTPCSSSLSASMSVSNCTGCCFLLTIMFNIFL